MRKKICLLYNHFQLQDGVNRSAIAIANEMVKRNDVEITLIPLYTFDPECFDYLDKRVIVKKGFGFYFRGLGSIIERFLPPKFLYKWLVNDKYDVNIAFQYGVCEKIIASGTTDRHKSIGWMHGYDEGLVCKQEYLKIGKVVCVSKCNADRLRKEMNNAIEVDFNYNPIDDEKIRIDGNIPIDIERRDCMQFITVGRMSPEKGFGRLLNIAAELKNNGYQFSLWLIGDGPLLPLLKQQCKKLKLEKEVLFLGGKRNPHAYTAKSDVFICSSFSEGYSTVCTEAVMLGVPVVSTCVSGADEIISEAECGLVCGMDDQDLYEALKYCLDNIDIVNAWKNTLRRTRYKFSPSMRIKRFCKIIGLDNE